MALMSKPQTHFLSIMNLEMKIWSEKEASGHQKRQVGSGHSLSGLFVFLFGDPHLMESALKTNTSRIYQRTEAHRSLKRLSPMIPEWNRRSRSWIFARPRSLERIFWSCSSIWRQSWRSVGVLWASFEELKNLPSDWTRSWVFLQSPWEASCHRRPLCSSRSSRKDDWLTPSPSD